MAQLGSFGPLVFEVSAEKMRTWRQWRETLEARYGEHDVLDGTQKDQFLGVNLRGRRIRLTLVRGLTEPEDDITTLENMLKAGEAYPLITGSKVHGNFSLRSMDVEREMTDNKGRLIIAEVSLEVKESL